MAAYDTNKKGIYNFTTHYSKLFLKGLAKNQIYAIYVSYVYLWHLSYARFPMNLQSRRFQGTHCFGQLQLTILLFRTIHTGNYPNSFINVHFWIKVEFLNVVICRWRSLGAVISITAPQCLEPWWEIQRVKLLEIIGAFTSEEDK